jgi:UDP-glucose 4-epimerase
MTVSNHGARALVIGANGFLGSCLVDRLVADGTPVSAFDRYSTEPRHHVCDTTEVVRGDFLNEAHIGPALAGCDTVFHFLSLSTPADSGQDPGFDVRTNTLATVRLLQLAVEAGVSTFYFASSGGTVYGRTSPAGGHAEDDPLQPFSPYGISKVAIENYLTYFAQVSGLRSVSLRMSNPFGPHQKPAKKQGLIPILLRLARDGRPVTMLGDGSMRRDYIYADDAVEMIMQIARREPEHRAYNVGSGQGASVAEIFDLVAQVSGEELVIERAAMPPWFVQESVLDVTRFRDEFGPPAQTPLLEGIRHTWEAIRDE